MMVLQNNAKIARIFVNSANINQLSVRNAFKIILSMKINACCIVLMVIIVLMVDVILVILPVLFVTILIHVEVVNQAYC